MTNQPQGLKHDEGKLRLDLIPPTLEEAVARVLMNGALKYEDNNWLKGVPFSKNYGAAKRHLDKWYRGVDFDAESGLNHLAHAITDLMMILHFQMLNDTSCDDRPYKGLPLAPEALPVDEPTVPEITAPIEAIEGETSTNGN
jgi:hypothetical protein